MLTEGEKVLSEKDEKEMKPFKIEDNGMTEVEECIKRR